MKNFVTAIALLCSSVVSSQAAMAAAKVDPLLYLFAQKSAGISSEKTLVPLPTVSIVALVWTQMKNVPLPTKYDTRNVLRYLQTVSNGDARQIVSHLRAKGATQQSIRIKNFHWINNSFSADVTAEGLKLLAATPGIYKIYADQAIVRDPGFRPEARRSEEYRYDFKDIGLDKVIAEFPDLTGKGVLLGHLDTGVDGKHPALAGKVAVFYDAETRRTSQPVDPQTHGTHTAGTMVGGDRATNFIGMAPDAKLVASGALGGYSQMLDAMQFMLDPDKNPDTADLPRAINNSWNCNGAPDVELFYRAVEAWEAAGILPVFSAGNSGPGNATITAPHEHPIVLAVGATGEDGKITSFSSRGPGYFRGKETQKPDITAPGDDIYSAIPGGKYQKMSGTSMASPHVAGVTGLLVQANPQLSPAQLKAILMKSATPMKENGSAGVAGVWNKVYGVGKMNIYDALKLASGVSSRMRERGVAAYQLLSALWSHSDVISDIADMVPGEGVFSAPDTAEGAWVSGDQL